MKVTTGTRLKEIMRERNIKQVDILRLCEPFCKKYDVKLEKNDLSQYVNDKAQPKQDKLSILGMALKVSEVWLMGYDVPKDNIEELERKMVKARLDYLTIDENNSEALSENEKEFNSLKQDKTFLKALELYKLYNDAIPEIQSAVDGLLKVPRQDS